MAKVAAKKPASATKPKSKTASQKGTKKPITTGRSAKILKDAISAAVGTHTDLKGARPVVRNGKIVLTGDRAAMKKAMAIVKADEEKRKLAGNALKHLLKKAKGIIASGEVPKVAAAKKVMKSKDKKKPTSAKKPKKVTTKKPAAKKPASKPKVIKAVKPKKPAVKPKKVAAKPKVIKAVKPKKVAGKR